MRSMARARCLDAFVFLSAPATGKTCPPDVVGRAIACSSRISATTSLNGDSVRIYRVPEPAPGDAETAPPETFDAKYADGAHNAEAMFVVDSDLFIVTRDRDARVYRASIAEAGSRDLTFRRYGQLGLGAVTDAETSTDEKSVVVRTSREAVLYRTDDLIRGGNVAPYLRIPIGGLREEQGEGVALDGNMLYLASEGRRGGAIVTLRCDQLR